MIIPFSAILSFVSPPAGLALVISSSTALGGITMNYPGAFLQASVGALVLFSIVLKRMLEKDLFDTTIQIEDYVFGLLISTIIIMGLGHAGFNNVGTYIHNIFLKKHSSQDDFWGLVFMSRWIYFIILGSLAIRSSRELLYLICFLILGGLYQILAIPLDHYNFLFVRICKEQGSSEGLQILNTNRTEIGYYFALSTALSFVLFKIKNINPNFVIAIVTMNLLLTFIASSKGPLASIIIFIPVAIYLLRSELKKCIVAILFVAVTFCGIFQACNYNNFFTANYLNTIMPSINSRLSLYQGGIDTIEHNNNLNYNSNNKLKSSSVQATFSIENNNTNVADIYRMTGSGSGTHNLFFDIYINNGLLMSVWMLLLCTSLMLILFINIKNRDEGSKIMNYFFIALIFILGPKLILSTAAHVSMWPGVILGVTFGLTKYYRSKVNNERSFSM